MHSRKPEGEWFGRFAADHGGFGRTRLEMSLAGPVVEEELFLAVAGAFAEEDGFFENSAFPDGVDFRESWSGRLSVRWTPAPEWEIGFSADWERFRDGAQRISSLAEDPFSAAADFAGQTRIDRNAQ